MKIVVLAGGLSHERDVSMSSGSQIANALRKAGHRVILVDAYTGWPGPDPLTSPDFIFPSEEEAPPYTYVIPEQEPDLDALRTASGNGDALLGPHVLDLCRAADLVFIGLHGGMGENGMIQATLEVMGIRFTGTGYTGCLLAMDKDLSKILMRTTGVPTPQWTVLEKSDDNATIRSKTDPIGFPCVVKPCSNGSSIGVAMANCPEELQDAVHAALRFEDRVMVEKKVTGREFSVGVLGGTVLPVIEIVPVEGFYDYVNKYQPGRCIETCPAELPEPITSSMQASALQVGALLRLGDYYRVDYMLDANGFHCLEANTLPGMTPASLIPQEAAAVGIDYVELCDRIVRLAYERGHA